EFDGLRRIADAFPQIETSPLIILVDQFEEIYTLCPDTQHRDAFVANLLHAAGDRTQHVSVILTLRSDFLGETQQHLALNALISEQGYFVPMMQPEELKGAIAEPARRAGHELDPATIQLLVEQTQGRQGTLPLLQVALTRMWDGLEQGYHPLETLERIGGVGGALADEAQQLYQKLNEEERAIAPRIFVALVQVDGTSEVTRRRATKTELITSENDAPQVEAIINRFAAAKVRFLVTSFDKEQGEVVEVAHEALLRSWGQLKEWIAECRDALRQKHKIDRAAEEWARQGKPKGYLLQGRPLQDAKAFMKTHENNRVTALSRVAIEFIEKGVRKRRISQSRSLGAFLIFPLMGTILFLHFLLIERADLILSRTNDCQPDRGIKFLLNYMILTGYKYELKKINVCEESLHKINLSDATLSDSRFENANLAAANFKGARIRNSNFQGVLLVQANLENSILIDSDFGCSQDHCADLLGANLKGANLSGVDFQSAILFEANLHGSDLTNANLLGVEELKIEQFQDVTLCNTTLPSYLNVPGDRDC
ncbi:MAG: pentapeptide repeat-containing protein, partial [Leptolyngbyaceae bacterium]|nr:pentapeptide repeat-containing protein [Leptolyngbyaceae bacterium]